MLKKYLLISLLFFLSVLIFGGETEIQMTQWIRYTHLYTSDTLKTTLTTSAFSLDRGYVRLNYKYNDNLKVHFTTDIYTSDKFTEGAGLKIKDGYLKISNLLPIPNLDLNIGLQKTYFSRIYDWEYLTVEKAYTDKYKVLASADYGISLTGILPRGLGQYNLGLYNGEGYTKVGKYLNTKPALLADLRFIPLAGLTIGSSVLYEKENYSAYNYEPTPPADTINKNRFAVAPFAKIAFGIFSLEGEYILYRYDRVHHDTTGGSLTERKKKYDLGGFWLMPIITIKELKLELLGRFDLWQHKEDGQEKDNKSSRLLLAGLNYYPFGKNLAFQFNWQREEYKDKKQPKKDVFYFQIKGSWKGLITEQ